MIHTSIKIGDVEREISIALHLLVTCPLYGLEHAYTNNPTSAKIFYFLLQIAHMLAQLLEKGDLLKKAFPAGFGSEKNLAFRLLEAW